MKLDLPIAGAEVRTWQERDLEPLVRIANNRDVARNLRDRFPHPYDAVDGLGFLHWVAQQPVESVWAIALDGSVVGGIGLQLGHDIERVSAESGTGSASRSGGAAWRPRRCGRSPTLRLRSSS